MKTMRIGGARVQAVNVPRASTLTTAYGPRNDAATVLVEVETEDGLVGLGQAPVDIPYYGESAEGMVANIRAHLVPAILGESPFDIERLNLKLQAALPGHRSSQAAVELALWDLKGKALGVPLYQLLGGRVREGIGLMGAIPRTTPERMAGDASALLDSVPYPVIKLKVGIDVAEDVERYVAVEEAVRGRAVLQVDGNAGYRLAEALPAIAAMESAGSLAMVEQPVARLADLGEIARRFAVPVMADESLGGPETAIAVVGERAVSAGMLKIANHGGLLNVMKIAAIFEAAGVTLSIGIDYDVIAAAAAHLAASIPAIRWPSPFTDLTGSILKDPPLPDGLVLRPPEGPGFGVELDEDRLREYALDL